MFVASYRNTERGILARTMANIEVDRIARINEARCRREQIQRDAERRTERAIRKRVGSYKFAEIERRTCRLFKVRPTELYADRRHRRIVFARQFLMYWACRLTTLSMPQIGRLMRNRDHTTILHGTRAYVQKRAYQKRTLRPISRSIQHRKEG